MQGLLLRLSTLDADAASAVRVIAYFDSLVRDHGSVPVLLRATARLAQCPVGLLDAATGEHTRVSAAGVVDHPSAPAAHALARGLSPAMGTVWMEREGPAHGLDEIVLERFAAAAEVALERAVAGAQAVNDPALVELVLSARTGEAERARALRLLGFAPAARVQVLAAPAGQGAALLAHLRAGGHHARSAVMGETAAVIVTPEVEAVPRALRAGVGPLGGGAEVAGSWAGARVALRFTAQGTGDHLVRWSELGALALFAAHVPGEAIEGLADVRAVRELAARPRGGEVLEAVRALCEEGSVRRAAVAVHLHHSSMAARIARAEAALGFSLSDSAGRLRAQLALALVRLGGEAAGAGGVSGPVPGAGRPRARRRSGG
ncbi:helix-turn-helix domain-containing protein [Sphaerisporangium sp. NBC_01403]|uniref:helix-turn-helix domain-containing protein n=1 Tax=Sphaerisporangium sp. NBC_01403 TaxID=2903599 RepID=UPI00324F3E77